MGRSQYGRRALGAYSAALSAAQRDEEADQPYCLDHPERYADYDEDAIPDEGGAAALCAPCPLLGLCFDNARRVKPGWGIHGGVAWALGRQWPLVDEEDKKSIISSLKA